MTSASLVPIAFFTLFFATAAVAQTATADTQNELAALKARAVENCHANRGVDCVTPQGLQEWELLERSPAQAARDGAHRRPPPSAQGTK